MAEIKNIVDRVIETDVLVVGGGGAAEQGEFWAKLEQASLGKGKNVFRTPWNWHFLTPEPSVR